MAEGKLTNAKVLAEFKEAYESKQKLIERQKKDFQFALGKQWEDKDRKENESKGVLCVTDNRIRPNLFLLTGLERQNRADFRAYPEGEEDSLKAQIATALYKNVMKQSDGEFKFSEMFEDGVTCGESYIELYLDATYNLLNPKPNWKKSNFDQVFPEPGWKEYDFSDASYLYKLTQGIRKGDLISLYPEKKKKIEALSFSVIGSEHTLSASGVHQQGKDYPKSGSSGVDSRNGKFDLLERYYKKWVEKVFTLDALTGDFIEVEEKEDDDRTAEELAQAFVDNANRIPAQVGRFKIIKRTVPEIWVYSLTPGIEEELANERAWFYPRWKGYPIIPYLAHWTNAPLDKEDQHLNIQGIVAGVRDVQILHNKAETLKLRHLNSSANSGWLTEEDTWVDESKVENFGSVPGVNLSYKRGKPKPERITPVPLSSGHEIESQNKIEAIKAQLGINSDLLASQSGGTDSGRAIALRQRQGVVMVQKLFDNLSRTKKIAGRFILSQLSEIYDRETVKKILGPAFIQNSFGEQSIDESTGQPIEKINEQALNDTIAAVLEDINLGKYDVAVGEAVASETMRAANYNDLQQFSQSFPGFVSPDIIIQESQLPVSVKDRVMARIRQRQAEAMANSRTGQKRSGGEMPMNS